MRSAEVKAAARLHTHTTVGRKVFSLHGTLATDRQCLALTLVYPRRPRDMRYASPCVPIVRIEMRAWAYGAYGAEHAMADAIECATCRCYYFVCV